MKNGILKRRLTHIAGSASAVLLLGGMLAGCKDDLLTGMPDWLGSSIYEWLENPRNLDGSPYDGTFKETLKLISAQDEDYVTVLKKTGSKTLFVADDEAWQRFYQNNPWGARSMEDLSSAQKKLLFKSNMINSAYLCELLGNLPAENSTKDPIEGSCMRRASSTDLSDSIPVIYSYQYPEINEHRVDPNTNKQIDYWSEVRDMDTMKIFMDGEVASMIHFMPKFMQFNGITNDDVEFMTNGGIKSNNDAFVNGKVIKEKDVVCMNGYIQVLEDVGLPMDNMANVIANNPKFSQYNRLLNRFSYPQYNRQLSDLYGDGDSVFVKKFFNLDGGTLNSPGPNALTNMRDGTLAGQHLKYDPGWNRYVMNDASKPTFQQDAAMMLVPTDEAMREYLDTDGSDLKERYGTGDGYDAWDNAPDEVVLPLLDNTMHTSLKSAIPSNFVSIMNTASEPMGVKKSDIDFVHWACNGVIYETNRVYVAPEYVSVYYPCVIRGSEDLNLLYTTIENDNKVAGGEGFKAYLNAMGSTYSFIIPSDQALKHYYDPVSYKRTNEKEEPTSVMYQFYVNSSKKIAARAYLVDWTDLDQFDRPVFNEENELYSPAPTAENGNSRGAVFNHMKDIINSSMAMGLFVPGQKFYLAKNGSPIIVDWDGDKVRGVAGSFQYERGYYIPVKEYYDKSDKGNGRSYVIDEEPLMSTMLSPYSAIMDPNREEFQAFAQLLGGCNFIGSDDRADHVSMDNSLTNLANYNYTIYVPTTESIEQMIADHILPTGEDRDLIKEAILALEDTIDAVKNLTEDPITGDPVQEMIDYMAELTAKKEFLQHEDSVMASVLESFVAYHIQDNSVYVEGEPHSNDVYESACLDYATNRFVKLYVNYNLGGDLTVLDNSGRTHKVNKDLCNLMTRQYYFNGKSLKGNACDEIYSSSFVVIHSIDSPLVPFKDNDENHPNNGYYSPATYQEVMDIVNAFLPDEPEPEPEPLAAKSNKVNRLKR